MKLMHACPKCHKPTKIQSEFPVGNLITYVYQCGHLELRTKIITPDEISKELNQELKKNQTQVKIIEDNFPEPTFDNLTYELENWYSEGGRLNYEEKVIDLTQLQLENMVNESGIDINADFQKNYIAPSFFSVDGSKCAYEFQREGIRFAERTELNCLIADAMGLGKTIQALIALKRNKVIAFPCLIIVKGATLFQWAHEFQTWVSPDFTSCIPVTNRSHLIKGFDAYILSMDMLSKPDIVERLLTLGLKTAVIDEVQNFKDPSAKRTVGLLNLINLGNIKYKLALSGTPIKNRANEYFTILNILAPSHFWSKDEFQKYWLVSNEKNVYTRINPFKLDKFKELTSRWIIRRERYDVLKNLPSLTRDYQIIEIDDKQIRNSYNHTLDLFKNFLNNTANIKSQDLLGWLAQLRAITGQAKCKQAIEWTRDFLESTDESLAIGIQHHSVRDTLYYVLDQMALAPLKLSGEDSVYRKADIVRAFTSGANRLLVINSLAGGVGLNLQTCANALVLERQWNSADEEQFESRFHRDGQQKAVTVTYMIAKNTIDEFFHEMVQAKRKILVETGIGSQFDLTSNIDFLRNLSDFVVSHKI